jgi:peptide deformylase
MVFNETAQPGHAAETVLVNPVILEKSRATNIDEEGCLSFPKIYADVEVGWVGGMRWAGWEG